MVKKSWKGEDDMIRRHAVVVATVLPIILTSSLVFWFKIDVPVWDDWELLPLIEKLQTGNLSFQDTWQQHNCHRILFPKLILLLLAEHTNWNITYVLAASLLLAFCTMVFLIYQISLSSDVLPSSFMKWLLPITSLLVFSMTQRGAWYWGWELQLFLATTAVVGGIVFLSLPSRRLPAFVVSIACGVIASFSFATGLIYWFIGLFVLVLSQKERYRFAKIIIWISTSTLVYYAYFSYGYDTDTGSGASRFPVAAISDPLSYLYWVFSGLGAPIITWDKYLPFVCGISGFGFVVFCFVRFRKDAPDTLDRLLPFYGFGLYSLGGLLLTGLGRMDIMSAKASRYHTFSMLFWVAFFFIFFTFMEWEEKKQKNHGNRRIRYVHRIALVVILLCLVSSYARETRMAAERYRFMLPAQEAVLNSEKLEDRGIAIRLHWDVEVVKERINTVQDMKLNVFSGERNKD